MQLTFHSPKAYVRKMTPKGIKLFRTNRVMPYNGEVPMWAMLRDSDRIKLVSSTGR